jgi:hypothetical protein
MELSSFVSSTCILSDMMSSYLEQANDVAMTYLPFKPLKSLSDGYSNMHARTILSVKSSIGIHWRLLLKVYRISCNRLNAKLFKPALRCKVVKADKSNAEIKLGYLSSAQAPRLGLSFLCSIRSPSPPLLFTMSLNLNNVKISGQINELWPEAKDGEENDRRIYIAATVLIAASSPGLFSYAEAKSFVSPLLEERIFRNAIDMADRKRDFNILGECR